MLDVPLSCPRCRASLTAAPERCDACGAAYGTFAGVPMLMPDADPAEFDLRETGGALPPYDCAGFRIPSLDAALADGRMVLELGAGLEVHDAANLIRTDAFVYGAEHLDAIADAHALPFADASFDYVLSLAVFEHLHSPWLAAQEIARVLRPGGTCFTLAAFMQPLHGYPSHYFNATAAGLSRLFQDDFDIVEAGPSRYCTHRQALVQGDRMREMARDLRDDESLGWRTRLRAWRMDRALGVAGTQYVQLAERASRREVGYAAWEQIAPAVEVIAVRRS